MNKQETLLKACKDYTFLKKINTGFNFSPNAKKKLSFLSNQHEVNNFILHSLLLDLGITNVSSFNSKEIIDEIKKFRLDERNNDFQQFSFKLPVEIIDKLKTFRFKKKIPLLNEAHYIAFFSGLESFNKLKS